MRKFDVRFCSCGRIHFVPNADIEAALEVDKELWLICGGCGKTLRIGADIGYDWEDPDKLVYNMYTIEHGKYENYELTTELFEASAHHKGILKVIHSVGKHPVMMTGMHATHFNYACCRFEDSWYPDFWKIQRDDITVKEIFEFIENWQKDRIKVNMNSLLCELTEEEAECLSGHLIKGLDWSGTKYEKKYK